MSDQTPNDPHHKPTVRPVSPPMSVPVYNCVVYVSRNSSGQVQARVANLDGLAVEARNEREALSQLVVRFKQQVAEHTTREEPIPWLDPSSPARPDEQERQIPVHL